MNTINTYILVEILQEIDKKQEYIDNQLSHAGTLNFHLGETTWFTPLFALPENCDGG
jgi:hypothetical protein